MAQRNDLHHTIRQIRRRLFLLLMQAFGMVVALNVIILLALVTLVVNTDLIGYGVAFTVGRQLQGYYAGRGSWDGVGAILNNQSLGPPDAELDWQTVLLLDNNGIVIVDRGRTDTALVGQVYRLTDSDLQQPLLLEGQPIGRLIVQRTNLIILPGYLVRLGFPILFVSFFTFALTLLIGFLLTRRVVTPLADVIGAARVVAAGDLSARAPIQGPGDLRSLSDSFNHMADALERNDQERRNFLADIAHELRTPLTVIRGRLEGILDGIYPADDAHVAPVLEETYVLERLVEDLRLLTLAESRQLHFDIQPVDLGELAKRAADLFRAQADEKELSLFVSVVEGTPHAQADPQRMGQVIGNLLNNAIRYVPVKGQIEIEVRPQAGGVQVAVRDNGPGVPEADLPKLFDRFWRGEKSRTRTAGGVGLGLAIARQLVEAQGGSIRATNRPSGGLEVAFVV